MPGRSHRFRAPVFSTVTFALYAAQAHAQTDTVTLSLTNTSDWNTAWQAAATITNNATWAINNWQLEFDSTWTITSIWDARIVSHAGTRYVIAAVDASWEDGDLSPGETKGFGFIATPGGGASIPNSGLLNNSAVLLNGVSPAPPPPPVVPAPPWPDRVFAPYVDATGWPPLNYPAATTASNTKFFSLGFIVANPADCSPSWGTYYSMSSGFLKDEINAIRSAGGDVVPSFGGAANDELALCTTDISTLKNKYLAVVNEYQLTHIDFDIEGAAITDQPSIDRRSRAIAMLQQELAAAGRPLSVSLTLPVLPTGLTADGLSVVTSALTRGVIIDCVNVMAMDYGQGPAPNGGTDMGIYAIQAATTTQAQVKSAYAAAGQSLSDAAAWHKIGVTPMIGVNDFEDEIFRIADAAMLRDFAIQQNLSRLAFWSANRDAQCPAAGMGHVANDCSGIPQQPWEFSITLQPFTTAAPSPQGDMNCDGVVNNNDAPAMALALTNPSAWTATYNCNIQNGDFNNDHQLTGQDIPGFITRLLGG